MDWKSPVILTTYGRLTVGSTESIHVASWAKVMGPGAEAVRSETKKDT